MWLIFQSGIMFAVIASNIHWKWTPNPYIPALAGIGCAFVLTRLIHWVGYRLNAHGRQNGL